MDRFNTGVAYIVEAVLYPFRSLNSWVAMLVVSLGTAVVMLIAYRLTSNQEKIRAAKGKIIAHLLEVRLYKESLPVSMKAQGFVLWHNLQYLAQSLRTMLILILPMVLVLIHLDQWFGRESVSVGQQMLLKVRLNRGHALENNEVAIRPSRYFKVETPPLRIDSEGEVDWRLRAVEPGTGALLVAVNDERISKEIVIAKTGLSKISAARVSRNWLSQLANPGEPSISSSDFVKSIEVDYPPRLMNFFGWRVHWLVVYFILSVVFAFALKGLFKVEI